jgi:hypothetical protein
MLVVHCCRDKDWVSKIMSTHSMLNEIQDHLTYRCVEGTWKTFKFTKPFSLYCQRKNWADDHNNRQHDPIELEEVWQIKWWPIRQFTFICFVVEVNAFIIGLGLGTKKQHGSSFFSGSWPNRCLTMSSIFQWDQHCLPCLPGGSKILNK